MYGEVRRSTVAAASDRLDRTTAQLSQLLTQSTRARFAVIESTTTAPAVQAFMHGRGPAPVEALQKLAGASVQLITSVELWDPAGRRLTRVAASGQVPALDSLHAQSIIGSLREGKSAVGRFERNGDSVTYALVSSIGDGGTPLGYLVERRRLSASPQGSRALADLIGEHASLAIGNATGDVWTDFTRPIAGLPESVLAPGLHQYQGDSGTVFARSARIPSTPWQVVVEFRRDQVLARVNTFVLRLALITLALLVVGVGAAWITTRRIITPLRQVTEAAEAIAAGRHTDAITADRADEIGRLTRAFNTMSSEVSQSRARLELLVEERTAKLQQTMQELEAFSYTVSHDLRAPLRAMQGFAQALLEDYSPALDATGKDYAQRVVDASRRMDDLIHDLLSYSKLAREELSLTRLDLDPVVAEVAREVQDEVGRRGGRLELRAPLGVVIANGRILQQVLSNLVGNAVKFVPPGVAPEIRISAEMRDGRRRLWVEDNGIGVAPEHRERIYRVFERLHGGDTYPGTGIGLAIVRRGMERMDGQTGVESTPGGGSRFWIELRSETTS
jgi:signal transduction histidine kinase